MRRSVFALAARLRAASPLIVLAAIALAESAGIRWR